MRTQLTPNKNKTHKHYGPFFDNARKNSHSKKSMATIAIIVISNRRSGICTVWVPGHLLLLILFSQRNDSFRIPAQFFLVLEKGPRFFFFFSDVGFVWFHLYFLFVSKKTEKEGGKTAFGFLLLLWLRVRVYVCRCVFVVLLCRARFFYSLAHTQAPFNIWHWRYRIMEKLVGIYRHGFELNGGQISTPALPPGVVENMLKLKWN